MAAYLDRSKECVCLPAVDSIVRPVATSIHWGMGIYHSVYIVCKIEGRSSRTRNKEQNLEHLFIVNVDAALSDRAATLCGARELTNAR